MGILETPRTAAALSAWYGALRRWQRSAVMLGALIAAGCSTVPGTPYTAAEQAATAIPNMADVRVFADVPTHLAPVGRQHINLTGDYLWDANSGLGPDGFRSLRTTATNPSPALAA
jgi:hypothetical protein